MSKLQTYPWDASDHLETKEDIIAYLEAALEAVMSCRRDPDYCKGCPESSSQFLNSDLIL
jgi:DNA-binding phage protein